MTQRVNGNTNLLKKTQLYSPSVTQSGITNNIWPHFVFSSLEIYLLLLLSVEVPSLSEVLIYLLFLLYLLLVFIVTENNINLQQATSHIQFYKYVL